VAKDVGAVAKDAGAAVKDAGAAVKDAGAVAPKEPAPAVKDAGAPHDSPAAVGKPVDHYLLVPIPTPDKKVERLWKSKCGSCHGNDGKAATEKGKKMKMTDLTAAAWQKSRDLDELRKAIREGMKREKDGVKQEMDPFKDELTSEQLDQLILYVRWLGAPR
jgi:cytochrome c553